MRVQSMICVLALTAATPALALTQEAAPAAPTAVTTAPDACAVAPAAVEQPQPRRRRGLGGLLRAVGSSGALAFVPGLGMAGQLANLAAGTAASAAAQGEQQAMMADAERQSQDAMRLAQCQMQAASLSAGAGR